MIRPLLIIQASISRNEQWRGRRAPRPTRATRRGGLFTRRMERLRRSVGTVAVQHRGWVIKMPEQPILRKLGHFDLDTAAGVSAVHICRRRSPLVVWALRLPKEL